MSDNVEQKADGTAAERLASAVKAYADSHRVKSKSVFLLDDVDSVIELHKRRYAAVSQDERPLLAVNKSIPGCVGGYGWSGLLLTDRKVYWRCLKDSFFSSLVALSVKGGMPLDAVRSIAIGKHDHCYGTNYVGHQLVVNGRVIGLLRMGGGILYDEDAINELTDIFKAI